MNLTQNQHGDITVLHLSDSRLDASIAIQFKDEFRTMTADAGDVVLDLSSVTFIDSSGLGAVVAAYKGLGQGRRMSLSGLQPAVEKVMALTRMNTVFGIYPDVPGALNAAGPTAAE